MPNFNTVPDPINLTGYTQNDLSRLAHGLGKASRNGDGFSCLCPAHDDHNPSCSLALGDHGKLLAHCHAGCPFSSIVESAHQRGLLIKGNGSDQASLPLMAEETTSLVSKEEHAQQKQAFALGLWHSSRPALQTPVETYLRTRIPFLPSFPDPLRFLPKSYHKETQSEYRAMIAPVTLYPSLDVSGIHQTFLSDDGQGKAQVDKPKKMLGSIKGGSVQLYPAGEILAVAEGIETALSFYALTQIPVWAALSAGNFEPLVLPFLPFAKRLIIVIDNDANGTSLKFARRLQERAVQEGREVLILRPLSPFNDCNDVLAAHRDKDFDPKTLLESVDSQNIDFLFTVSFPSRSGQIDQEIEFSAMIEDAGVPSQKIEEAVLWAEPEASGLPEESAANIETSAAVDDSETALPFQESLDPWDCALDVLHNSRKNLFITGAAGTGKSTLLKLFREQSHRKIAVVASTGVAALNAGGETLHKFFRFKPNITPSQIQKLSQQERLVYQQLEMLLIDEISMVRADVLDCVDVFLRKNGKYPDHPFGGVRIVMIGDPYQLPPVVQGEEGAYLKNMGYETPYFFSANCYKNIECVELSKIHRQQDENFITILNRIRDKTATEEDLILLNSRVGDPDAFSQEAASIYLTTTHKKVDKINQEELAKLESDGFSFVAEVSGDFKRSEYPAPAELILKKGAQVMMLNNDSESRWVNGSLGEIARVEADSVWVEIAGDVHLLDPHQWEIGERYFDGDDLKTRNVRAFRQYPLQLAWAITIHKSQGKTFDRAVIDLGNAAFAEGQTYVALSRCRSLAGICLKTPLTSRHILVDPKVTEFLHQARSQPPVEEPLEFPEIHEEVEIIKNSDAILPFVAQANSDTIIKSVGRGYVPLITGSDVDLARHLLNQELKQRYDEIVYDEGGFWKYGKTHWDPISYEQLAYTLHNYDGRFWINHEGDEKTLKIENAKVKNTLERLRTEGIALMGWTGEFFNDSGQHTTGINCLNGFIKIEKGKKPELVPNHKSHRRRFTIPFHFNPDLLESILNDDCPLWKNSLLRKLLYGCFKGDEDIDEKIRFLMQLAGVIVTEYALKLKQPKSVILYGETAGNGKSEILKTLKSLLSHGDVCSIDPKDFKNEYSRLILRNKKLNIVAELSGKALDSHYTKQIITGDMIEAREIYKMPINFRCEAQQVWAGNILPSFFGGMDKGVQRRMGLLCFNRVIPDEEKEIDIGERIAREEGQLLLGFAVLGAIDVINEGDFVFPTSSLDIIDQWKGEADNALGFIQECVRASGDHLKVSSQSVYDHYVEWAKRSGIRADHILTLKGFIQRFKNNLPAGITYKRTNAARGFEGLELLPFEEGNHDFSKSAKK